MLACIPKIMPSLSVALLFLTMHAKGADSNPAENDNANVAGTSYPEILKDETAVVDNPPADEGMFSPENKPATQEATDPGKPDLDSIVTPNPVIEDEAPSVVIEEKVIIEDAPMKSQEGEMATVSPENADENANSGQAPDAGAGKEDIVVEEEIITPSKPIEDLDIPMDMQGSDAGTEDQAPQVEEFRQEILSDGKGIEEQRTEDQGTEDMASAGLNENGNNENGTINPARFIAVPQQNGIIKISAEPFQQGNDEPGKSEADEEPTDIGDRSGGSHKGKPKFASGAVRIIKMGEFSPDSVEKNGFKIIRAWGN